MIKLNLISPEQKYLLKRRLVYRGLESILGLILIASVVLAVCLLFISRDLTVLEVENQIFQDLSLNKNSKVTDEFQSLNKKINIYHELLSNNLLWSQILTDVSGLTPDNLYLNKLTSPPDSKKIIFQGFALKRDDLLTFIAKLENSGKFLNVKSPLTNYLSQNNVLFNIEADLNYEIIAD